MRTLLFFLGIIIAVALVAGAVIYSILGYAGSMLDDSGKAYVDKNLPAIIEHWSVNEMTQRESDEFRRATSDADLASLFAQYKKLGELKNYAGCTGHAAIDPTKDGLKTTATYIATATFDNGPAEIKISLVQINDDWRILGFRVSSPLLE